ncbi:FAD-dependent oxidoreductase [Candidatus Woesearchaeota archaeon]|nr:FAD-dependent oxidoreductase [Candidatus Woesearchaeota archaeon]
MIHKAKILEIIEETHDTKSIKFEKPEGFNYKPGQYCIFDHRANGEIIKRSYSLSSSPTEDFLMITVKHIPNGIMSTHLHQVGPGDVLDFVGPVGKFVFEESMKKVVLVAGGSGISPFRGMSEYIIDKKLDTQVIIIYGSRTPKDIILQSTLEKYNQEHDNIRLFLTVDHPDDGWKFHQGFISIDFIREAIKGNLQDYIYFLIGPPLMVTSVKDALMKAGLPEEIILLDAWG